MNTHRAVPDRLPAKRGDVTVSDGAADECALLADGSGMKRLIRRSNDNELNNHPSCC